MEKDLGELPQESWCQILSIMVVGSIPSQGTGSEVSCLILITAMKRSQKNDFKMILHIDE